MVNNINIMEGMESMRGRGSTKRLGVGTSSAGGVGSRISGIMSNKEEESSGNNGLGMIGGENGGGGQVGGDKTHANVYKIARSAWEIVGEYNGFIEESLERLFRGIPLSKDRIEIFLDLLKLENGRLSFSYFIKNYSEENRGAIIQLKRVYFDELIKFTRFALQQSNIFNDFTTPALIVAVSGSYPFSSLLFPPPSLLLLFLSFPVPSPFPSPSLFFFSFPFLLSPFPFLLYLLSPLSPSYVLPLSALFLFRLLPLLFASLFSSILPSLTPLPIVSPSFPSLLPFPPLPPFPFPPFPPFHSLPSLLSSPFLPPSLLPLSYSKLLSGIIRPLSLLYLAPGQTWINHKHNHLPLHSLFSFSFCLLFFSIVLEIDK